MKFIKNNAKYIMVIMMCIFGSVLATMATNYAFESSDVKFDNTGTSLESVNVQDAIDETFHHVTDYNEIKTTIGNSTLTTTNQTLTGGINELNGKIANKLRWVVASNETVSTRNAWTDFTNTITIDTNTMYLIVLVIAGKISSYQFMCSGTDLSGLNTSTPGYLVPSIDESNAKELFIAYNSTTNKLQYYCGTSVFQNKTLAIYAMDIGVKG